MVLTVQKEEKDHWTSYAKRPFQKNEVFWTRYKMQTFLHYCRKTRKINPYCEYPNRTRHFVWHRAEINSGVWGQQITRKIDWHLRNCNIHPTRFSGKDIKNRNWLPASKFFPFNDRIYVYPTFFRFKNTQLYVHANVWQMIPLLDMENTNAYGIFCRDSRWP